MASAVANGVEAPSLAYREEHIKAFTGGLRIP